MAKHKTKPGTLTNICFDCQNALGGCSFSRLNPDTNKPAFEPVDGWTAEEVPYCVGNWAGKAIFEKTYHVISCPEFVRDERRIMIEEIELEDEQ